MPGVMRLFKRAPAHDDPGEALRRTVSNVTILPDEDVRDASRARLRRIVAEAVLLQDKAAELLAEIRDRRPLSVLAPRGGPMATRFFELRRELPPPADLAMARQCETVSVVLDHHGTLIVTALQMLSVDWRSDAIVDQLERLDGLGAPALRLDAVYDELAALSFLSLLTGSFSTPAGENPTVAMVEAAYRHHGLDARYLNCEVAPDALGDAVRGARAMGWAGFNCSIPHKVAVIEHLDGLAESAEVIGAVNCVVRRDGRYVGENTDGQGFLASLRTVADPAGRSLVVLGAGGAARAIAVEAALAGARSVTIVNRDRGRGEELAALVAERTPAAAEFVDWSGPFAVPDGTDIVVNATPADCSPRRRPSTSTASGPGWSWPT